MDAAVKMARIYLHEADHGRRRTLVQEILEILQTSHRARGVAVFRAVAGRGESGEVHATDMIRSVVNLPEAVEFFDTPERVDEALARLADIVPAGRTVVWDAICR